MNTVKKFFFLDNGGFDPSSITGLVGWFDGSDASSFVLEGADVSTWNDRQGNISVTQATTKRPDRTVDADGKYRVIGDGVDDILRSASAFSQIMNIQKLTIICAGAQGFSFALNLSLDNRIGIIWSGNTIVGVVHRAANTPAQVADSSPSKAVISMVFDGSLIGNAARLKMWKNGVTLSPSYTGTVPALTFTSPSSRMEICGRETFTPNSWLNGSHYECLFYNRDLTDSERESVEAYLTIKYSI